MKNRLIYILACMFFSLGAFSQVGYGFTACNDLYHYYKNPIDGIASPTSGSAILNLGAGPKVWFGNKKRSISLEGQAVVGFLGLSTKDYKGMGTVAFPFLAKLNFKGLSTFEREGTLGFSIGGGIQFNKTEIYGLTKEYIDKKLVRNYFKTYVIQAGYGFGISGFTVTGIVRYGFNADDKTNSLNFGLQYDFNMPMLKKIKNKESAL